MDKGKIMYDGTLDRLIARYAKHKLLSVVLDSYVPPEKLGTIGELITYDFPKAVIKVKRNASNLAAAELLRDFPVDDLNIEEPDIEDVIRDVFTSKVS